MTVRHHCIQSGDPWEIRLIFIICVVRLLNTIIPWKERIWDGGLFTEGGGKESGTGTLGIGIADLRQWLR